MVSLAQIPDSYHCFIVCPTCHGQLYHPAWKMHFPGSNEQIHRDKVTHLWYSHMGPNTPEKVRNTLWDHTPTTSEEKQFNICLIVIDGYRMGVEWRFTGVSSIDIILGLSSPEEMLIDRWYRLGLGISFLATEVGRYPRYGIGAAPSTCRDIVILRSHIPSRNSHSHIAIEHGHL